MEWNYKKVLIKITKEGYFIADVNKTKITTKTLDECKREIDSAFKDYFTFTKDDWNKMLKKLDKREVECIEDMRKELSLHTMNAYCELGIVNEDWDWDELLK